MLIAKNNRANFNWSLIFCISNNYRCVTRLAMCQFITLFILFSVINNYVSVT